MINQHTMHMIANSYNKMNRFHPRIASNASLRRPVEWKKLLPVESSWMKLKMPPLWQTFNEEIVYMTFDI